MANPNWTFDFQNRFAELESQVERPANSVGLSIKLRANGGCFHREHSPEAYRIIDRELESIPDNERDFIIESHESGPEVLLWLAVGVGGLNLSAAVLNLITAIIKARTEGILKGDTSSPVDLLVRGKNLDGEYKEEMVLQVDMSSRLPDKDVHLCLNRSIAKIFK